MAQLALTGPGRTGTMHPRETLRATGNIAAANAAVPVDCDGCASFTLDLRAAAFTGTVQAQGTTDGTNWQVIALRPLNTAAVLYVTSIAGAGAVGGTWAGSCAGFAQIRVVATAFTSGAVTAVLAASNAPLDQSLVGMVAPGIGTVTAAAGVAATLTLAAPGAGLRHYITYIAINRFAAALLTAGAAPVVVTTTNLPGTLAFSLPADAATQGSIYPLREDFAFPIAAVAQNTATTIVAPLTANVIWRVTAGFYVAP
jgi:hypothetical protein